MKRMHIFAAVAAAGVLILAVGLFNYAGYVFSGPFPTKGAVLVIEDVRPLSDIYIDNEKEATVPQDATTVRIRGLNGGTHAILVAHENAWPWISEFDATLGEEGVIEALQLPKDTVGAVVPNDDPNYGDIAALFSRPLLPTADAPEETTTTRDKLWITDDTIYIQRNGANTPEVILHSVTPVRAVAWYPGRTDTVLVAVSNGVFALDTRTGTAQNFQPVYKGNQPVFARAANNNDILYVRDGEFLFEISLTF